jgi:hypothetical protein
VAMKTWEEAWNVKRDSRDVVWHIRLAAVLLEHALRPWGNVSALVPQALDEVRNERVKGMNLISGCCVRLKGVLNILSGTEERFDPQASVEELIKYCDIALADLQEHGRLRKKLEEAGGKPPDEKPPEQN